MARNEYTPDKLDAIAGDLLEAVTTLQTLAAMMREKQMPHALIHGTTAENFHIPTVMEWVGKTNVDVRTQLRAFASGIQSRAEIQKQRNENQKLAAAKKPWKPKSSEPKAAKKRAT